MNGWKGGSNPTSEKRRKRDHVHKPNNTLLAMMKKCALFLLLTLVVFREKDSAHAAANTTCTRQHTKITGSHAQYLSGLDPSMTSQRLSYLRQRTHNKYTQSRQPNALDLYACVLSISKHGLTQPVFWSNDNISKEVVSASPSPSQRHCCCCCCLLACLHLSLACCIALTTRGSSASV